ncbi:SDR family oxidoreductase [Endozoicomonas lisbonensis]|uniref:SDR family oxidoreductase n=1 Tax=Endozoicomonas lisbonensis TaxID=3120522 RepID=UPI0033931569
METLNILIAGCGDVGCELARQLLLTNGFRVWGLRRTIDQLPEGVSAIPGDLSDPDRLGAWPETIDYVLYTAAADGHSPELYQKAYVTGLMNVINHLKKKNIQPRHLFFTSSTSVYHQCNGEWVDEGSDCHPQTFAGQTLLEAEKVLFAGNLPATSVRFGGIYGPGRNRLIKRVLEQKGCAKEPAVYSNRIHRDDCAGILKHLIQMSISGQMPDPVYIGVDCQPAPMHDVLHWIATQYGVELNDDHPAPPRSSKRCSNHKILDTGYQFKYPDYKAGYLKQKTMSEKCSFRPPR